MLDFDQLLKERGYKNRFHEFHNLMRFRIHEVLLVSSLYDSYILEEDGQLYEKILSEYHDLNLSQAPSMTRVSTGQKAIDLVKESGRFDVIMTTMNMGDMHTHTFARMIKETGLDIPVVLLTYDERELNEMMDRYDTSVFEKVFIWQGDFRILLSILKYIEDKRNVDHDTRAVGLQSIILIEDNVHFYSSFLPLIYTELFRHSQSLISEGINVPDKLLRMRARPKILLCSTYEEARHYCKNYEDCILGVISDIEFPREGRSDPEAGIRFAREVKASHFDIPILLQSDDPKMERVARQLGASFLRKSSPILLQELRQFMKNKFSFGDFVFYVPDGTVVGRAHDLRTLERELNNVPGESIKYHAERNHFSNWLKARTEFWLAHKLRPQKVSDFQTLEELREHLAASVHELLHQRNLGSISDFNCQIYDTQTTFARIGGGSLGGKARGLAFTNNLINNFNIRNRFKGIRIMVPPALVLGTDVFDQFLDENNLRNFALQSEDDQAIVNSFLSARIPEAITKDLASFLERIRYPLAVRSSSLLEDSKHLPFAGIYITNMLPNNHGIFQVRLNELLSAIKRVYASTFTSQAKAYLRATHYRLEEEKMAVIIQKLVGATHENRFYPDFAGVARSHNFYPRPPMSASDGIVTVGLGLGKMVIEGGQSYRFCPKYPTHDLQFAGIKDTFKNSQKNYYALSLDPSMKVSPDQNDERLVTCGLDLAEQDGTLHLIGSTLSVENKTLTEGLSRTGPRLVTFAPILKSRLFPLPGILQLIMDIGSWGMSSPVEIEFAVNLQTPVDEPKEFAFLQIRPLVKSHEVEDLIVEDADEKTLICQSPEVLGNGSLENIFDIVMVDPDRFDRSRSVETAQEVAGYNAQMSAEEKPYILIGMGRWGSADSWLGIPVKWAQISGARVIIETGFKDFKVVPSQGTHFFQNLASFRVGYFTVNAESREGFISWDWLRAQKPVSEKRYTRHLRFENPIIVKMNGHSHKGIILKPR